MAKNFEKEEYPEFFIPNNYDDEGKILDFCEKRNLIEGAVFGGLPAWIIIQTGMQNTQRSVILIIFIC